MLNYLCEIPDELGQVHLGIGQQIQVRLLSSTEAFELPVSWSCKRTGWATDPHRSL